MQQHCFDSGDDSVGLDNFYDVWFKGQVLANSFTFADKGPGVFSIRRMFEYVECLSKGP